MARSLGPLLREADGYFMGTSRLHDAAHKLVQILAAMGIPHAIAGAMALAAHGRRRLTEDIDLLTTRDGLARFKAAWLGRGYIEIAPGLKAVRDTEHDVRIDFLLAGDYPGDGKPKPVSFPEPVAAGGQAGDLPVLPLETLIELKLASGMTAPHRGQDLVDVMELIRVRDLPLTYAEGLEPYVREKFRELYDAAQIRDDY